MLKTAINDIRKPDIKLENLNIEINFFDNAFIPESYLPAPTERLKIYRRINNIKSIQDLTKLKLELLDRCGKLTDEVSALFDNAELNLISHKVGIKKISSHPEKTIIHFLSKMNDDVLDRLLFLIRNNHDQYQMDQSGKMNIFIKDKNNSNHRRKIVRNFINEIS